MVISFDDVEGGQNGGARRFGEEFLSKISTPNPKFDDINFGLLHN
jgi:hypothetical protein